MEALVYLAFIITGFLMGRATTATNKEHRETPKEVISKLNPLKALREHEERKGEKKEIERYEIIMQNIESYDGTSAGQKDVPMIRS